MVLISSPALETSFSICSNTKLSLQIYKIVKYLFKQ